jgi:hypothetical protein
MILAALTFIAVSTALAGIWARAKHDDAEIGNALLAIANAVMVVAGVIAHHHLLTALCTFNAAAAIWMWWNGGGGRRTRKAARQLGAKSKARITAMARRMSPSPIPSPVRCSPLEEIRTSS